MVIMGISKFLALMLIMGVFGRITVLTISHGGKQFYSG